MNKTYEVQKWQIWEGINPHRPCWSGVNLVCRTFAEAQELADYVEMNSRVPHRVMERVHE